MIHQSLMTVVVLLFLASANCFADSWGGSGSGGSISTPPGDRPQPIERTCGDKVVQCACSCTDPFDPRVKESVGIYSGKCLNTCEQRSAIMPGLDMLRELGYYKDFDPKYDVQSYGETLFVANVTDLDEATGQKKFYVAKIHTQAIQDVIIQIEHSSGLEAHGQLRFRFRSEMPIELRPQDTTDKSDPIFVNDLVYTVEALGPPGIPYKGDFGFKGQYSQSYRFDTLRNRATTMIKELKRHVWQWRVDGNLEERMAALKFALKKAQEEGYTNRYHTHRMNCILEVWDVIDHAFNENFAHHLIPFGDWDLWLPTKSYNHLKSRGLANKLPGRFVLDNLEVELGWESFLEGIPDKDRPDTKELKKLDKLKHQKAPASAGL